MFRGELTKVLITLFILFFATLSFANLADENGKKALQKLAAKLTRVGQDLELKEGSFTESMNGGGKQTNANDKNSFMSSTTYHSYVWDYCLRWVGGRQCDEWLPAYVSLHGQDGDRSPLEGEVYNAWNANRTKAAQTKGQDYGIWKVAANGNPYKFDGTLDRERLTEWRVKDNLKQNFEKVGTDAANRVVQKTYETGDSKDSLANMESLRMMAARWTKMFRNRLLSNIGDIRAMQPGIEVAQGEDIPDCNEYLNEVRRNQDRTRIDERVDPQNVLQIESRTKRLQERLALCQQAKNINAYVANVKAIGNQAKGTTPQGEAIDSALSRANLLAVDYTGIDVGEMPIDQRIQLREEDKMGQVTVWQNGGKNYSKVYMSNAEQLQGYNRQLASAEVGYQEVAARSNLIRGNKNLVSRYGIAPKQMNMVKLNDMTPDMMADAKEGGYGGSTGKDHPGERLETKPSELVVRRR